MGNNTAGLISVLCAVATAVIFVIAFALTARAAMGGGDIMQLGMGLVALGMLMWGAVIGGTITSLIGLNHTKGWPSPASPSTACCCWSSSSTRSAGTSRPTGIHPGRDPRPRVWGRVVGPNSPFERVAPVAGGEQNHLVVWFRLSLAFHMEMNFSGGVST